MPPYREFSLRKTIQTYLRIPEMYAKLTYILNIKVTKSKIYAYLTSILSILEIRGSCENIQKFC